jgi:hypothetical protein
MEDRRAFNNIFLLSNGNLATYAENEFAQAMVLILDLENDYKIIKNLSILLKFNALLIFQITNLQLVPLM